MYIERVNSTMKAPSSLFIRASILFLLTSCEAYSERSGTSKGRMLAGRSLEGLHPRVSSDGTVVDDASSRVWTWGILPQGGDSDPFQMFPPTKRATTHYANFILWLQGLASAASPFYAWGGSGITIVRDSLAEWLSERHVYGLRTIYQLHFIRFVLNAKLTFYLQLSHVVPLHTCLLVGAIQLEPGTLCRCLLHTKSLLFAFVLLLASRERV